MNELLRFRQEFADAYLDGRVRSVGLHGTIDDFFKKDLAEGLKHFPKRGKMIRREMGVHFYVLVPRQDNLRMPRKRVLESFDDFCSGFGGCFHEENPSLTQLSGVVVLAEKVPRSRRYPGEYSTAEIYDQRYVPVPRGAEDSVQVLVQKKDVLDVIFLSRGEASEIVREANQRYGTFFSLAYSIEAGKLSRKGGSWIQDKRARYINLISGRLLMHKARNHLIEVHASNHKV